MTKTSFQGVSFKAVKNNHRTEEEKWKSENVFWGQVKWGEGVRVFIGLPQGGALSTFVAWLWRCQREPLILWLWDAENGMIIILLSLYNISKNDNKEYYFYW